MLSRFTCYFVFTLSLLLTSLSGFSQTLMPGSVGDSFSVEHGQVNYSIPISVPAGRGGMQPSLSLDYTGGGNGLLGVGWTLSGASSITRCRATVVQDGYAGGINYNSKDRFCLDGQRLVRLSSGMYRTELDSYARIEPFGGTTYNPEGFIVRTKSGQVMTYGAKSNSYHKTSSGSLVWMLTKINDTTGRNAIVFSYNTDKHLQNIRYGENQINFSYESRDDDVEEFVHGKLIKTTKRLKTIYTRVQDTQLFNYRLSYKQRSHSKQSYLSTVTRCGSGHCLPSINLAWTGLSSTDSSWNKNSNYVPKVSVSRDTKSNRGVVFVDVNGDGLVDQLYHRYNSSSTSKGAFINTGKGWKRDDRFTPKFHISNKDGIDLGSRFVDLNGDGLIDQVFRRFLGNDTWQKGAYINTGSGWKRDDNFAPKVSFVDKNGKDYGGRLVDINGDGLVDHVFYRKGVRKGAYLNMGSGWKKDDSYTPRLPIVNKDGVDLGARFIDVNGDGLPDQIAYGLAGKNAYLNTGDGWKESPGYTPVREIVDNSGNDIGTRFVDVNGDGLVDQVYKHWHPDYPAGAFGVSFDYNFKGEGAYLNTGTRWKTSSDDRYVPIMHTAHDYYKTPDFGTRFIDVNGDGLVDQIKGRINGSGDRVERAYLGTGTGWKRNDSYAPKRLISRTGIKDLGSRFIDVDGDGFVDQIYHHYNKSGDFVSEGAYLNQYRRVALKSITHGNGSLTRNTTQITYKQLLDSSVYTKGSSASFPKIDIVSSAYVVSEVKVSDGIGGQLSTKYHYEGLKINPKKRGSLGFAKITKNYPETKKREVTEYDQRSFPHTGNVRRVTEYYKHQKINEAIYRYIVTEHTSGRRYKLNLERSVENSYDLGDDVTPVIKVVTTHSNIDGYGNIGQTEVNTTGGGETFKKITNSSYKNDSSNWHLGRLTEATVIHHSPYESVQRRQTRFSYDNDTGLLESQSIVNMDTGSALSTTNYQYNAHGQKIRTVLSAQGEASRITTSSYDSDGRLIKSCNVYNQCETHTFNSKGLLSSTTGPNAIRTRFYYDAMGRVIRERRADGNETITQFFFANSRECGELADNAYSCVVSETSGTQPAILQKDRLGREVRKIFHGFDERLVYRDTEYDNLGQVSRVSRDYYRGDQIYWATSEYDSLGRVVKTTEPGPHGGTNDIITRYDGLTTKVVSGSDRLEKTTVTNALGQKIRVEEEEGAFTDFTYNSDGNLLTTEVAGDSDTRISLSYDEFGRKTGMSDPDMGDWVYTYTAYSELASQTDAKGQAVTNTYDRLGRLIRRVEPEGTSRWYYGSNEAPLGSIGKLLTETTAGITKSYTYDSLGRPETTTTTIAGQGSFTSATHYDDFGRVERVDYPGSTNFYTQNVYNENGFLAQVRGSRSHAESHNLNYLRPLISGATDLADSYLTQAEKLRKLGDSYEKTLSRYEQMLAQQVVTFSQGSTQTMTKNIAHPYLHTSNKNVSYIKVPDIFRPIYSFGNIIVPHFKKSDHHYKVTRSGSTQLVSRITAAQFASVEASLIDRGDTVTWRNDSSVNCLCSLGSTLVKNLDDHQSILTSTAKDGLNLSPTFLGHLNNTLEELKLVIALLNRQAQGYEGKADELTLLAEQTLASADNSFQYSRTLTASADAYRDLMDDDSNYITYWRALDIDASGRTSAEVYGNGIVTDYAYNLGTGQLQNIHSSLVSLDPLRHIEYQYDDNNNVTLRDDLINDIRETYEYDRLERLTDSHTQSDLYAQTSFNSSQSVSYDTLGNMTYKSDVGDYSYGAGSAGPHAVTTAGSSTYRYDNNGNMISGNGRSIQWSSFNKPTQITQNGRSAAFSYGADRARYKKLNHVGDTTVYIGKLYERLTKANNSVDQKHYIYAAGQLVAEHIISTSEGTQTRYLHKDALGSIDMVTDAYANVVDRRSFDSWGKLRNLPWKQQASLDDPLYLTQLPFTNKGYTGHESVQEVDLIHMGGRMYDATLGRFISADPHIQSPSLSQSYNRYSYVINNPMKYNDPSGYFFKRLFKGIARAIRGIAQVIRPLIGAIGSAWACTVSGPACIGFAVGFSSGSTYAATGNIGQAVKSGFIAFATAQASGIVKNFKNVGDRILGHGFVGGTASVLQGGRFGSGFVSSAFAKAVSPSIEKWSQAAGAASNIVGAAGAALVGGTASVIGGGKFANGARTSAIQYLFNEISPDPTKDVTSGELELMDRLDAAIGSGLGGSPEKAILISRADYNTLIDAALDRASAQIDSDDFTYIDVMAKADTILFAQTYQEVYFSVEGTDRIDIGSTVNYIGVGAVAKHLSMPLEALDQMVYMWNTKDLWFAQTDINRQHNESQIKNAPFWSNHGYESNQRTPYNYPNPSDNPFIFE